MDELRQKLTNIQAKQIEAKATLNPAKLKRLAGEAVDGAIDIIGELINEIEQLKEVQHG